MAIYSLVIDSFHDKQAAFQMGATRKVAAHRISVDTKAF